MATTKTAAPTYTDTEALDEAVLILVRRLMRADQSLYQSLMAKLPEGARSHLMAAESRADRVRNTDELNGIKPRSRAYPDPYACLDADTED